MNTQFQQSETTTRDVYFDPEIEAAVSALEAKWAAEREAREAATVQ